MGLHRGYIKIYMLDGAQTLQASSARLPVALAAIYGLELLFSDVKLVYIQST